jgi:hypothetical protein
VIHGVKIAIPKAFHTKLNDSSWLAVYAISTVGRVKPIRILELALGACSEFVVNDHLLIILPWTNTVPVD